MTKRKFPNPEELASRLTAAERRIRRLQIALWVVATLCVIALLPNAFWLAMVILVVSVAILVPAVWLALRYARRRDEGWSREADVRKRNGTPNPKVGPTKA